LYKEKRQGLLPSKSMVLYLRLLHVYIKMIKVSLPDGSVKEFNKGATPMDVAMSISEGLARNVISASFNNTVVETKTALQEDGSLVLFFSYCGPSFRTIVSWCKSNDWPCH
jgi:(p)ppGpp synthase/HD superfamily hydrolase